MQHYHCYCDSVGYVCVFMYMCLYVGIMYVGMYVCMCICMYNIHNLISESVGGHRTCGLYIYI